jgi:hypothetical protein
LPSVAASPYQALRNDTMYLGSSLHQPLVDRLLCRYLCRSVSKVAFGIGRYPGRRSNSVGMSVEPWIDACPRSTMIPPPGRPMFPSSS